METALLINPHSLPERSWFAKLNPFNKDKFEDELVRDLEEVIDGEITVYKDIDELDTVPDQVVLYGGDGSVMMAYNKLLEMAEQTPPILLVGGGSGTYWTRNLGMHTLKRKERIHLLEEGNIKSFPLLKVEYDGELSPHDVSYTDSFGLGDLASWIHDAESIKDEWGSSKKSTPLERATYILLSYVVAGAEYLANLEREYYLVTDDEYATIHGSIHPLVGLGFNIYDPGDGFAVQSTPIGPQAHLTTLIEMAGGIVGLAEEETKKELSILTEGTVPMHLNGSPFTYEGTSISFTYELDKVQFYCP